MLNQIATNFNKYYQERSSFALLRIVSQILPIGNIFNATGMFRVTLLHSNVSLETLLVLTFFTKLGKVLIKPVKVLMSSENKCFKY
jgi:hypothetical protein